MQDKLGRKIEYIRISVTDRCNFRCKYCMPESGVDPVSHDEILTYDEIIRLCGIFADLGISKVKLTGGEPLVRRNLASLVKGIKNVNGINEVTLTTNGFALINEAQSLKEAGIDKINVSLDTLDSQKFKEITGVDGLSKVLEGIDKSIELGIKTKVNVVTLADYNYNEVEKLAGLAKEKPVDVRFIEMMPMGLGKEFKRYLPQEVMKKLEAEYGKARLNNNYVGNGPSVYYNFKDFKGNIGFISAISHKFCQNCNRVRLTSEGFLKLCLYYDSGIDLKTMLRGGKGNLELTEAIRKEIYEKPKGHNFSNGDPEDFRTMSKIGG